MGLSLAEWTLLRRSRLFASLTDDEIATLLPAPDPVSLTEGQKLFWRGEPAKAFFVVLDGWVTLSRQQPDGSVTVVSLFGPSESFAEALIIPGARYPVDAVAATPARLARFDTATFRTRVAENPRISIALIAAVYRQMHSLVGALEATKAWSARRRVADYLASLTAIDEGPATIALPVESQLIAGKLGMTASTFSKTLASLKSVGVIASARTIFIEDIAAFRTFVDTLAGETPSD